MRNDHSSQIRESFPDYQGFISHQKVVNSSKIVLREHKARDNCRGSSEIECPCIGGAKKFEAEVSLAYSGKYKLRVFADRFGPGPCFRFDSYGRAHCNPEDGRGLVSRRVMTPHFHRYDRDGNEIAFQTAPLREHDAAGRIASDHRVGVRIFCDEVNARDGAGNYPELVTEQATMQLPIEDPLSGISFHDDN